MSPPRWNAELVIYRPDGAGGVKFLFFGMYYHMLWTNEKNQGIPQEPKGSKVKASQDSRKVTRHTPVEEHEMLDYRDVWDEQQKHIAGVGHQRHRPRINYITNDRGMAITEDDNRDPLRKWKNGDTWIDPWDGRIRRYNAWPWKGNSGIEAVHKRARRYVRKIEPYTRYYKGDYVWDWNPQDPTWEYAILYRATENVETGAYTTTASPSPHDIMINLSLSTPTNPSPWEYQQIIHARSPLILEHGHVRGKSAVVQTIPWSAWTPLRLWGVNAMQTTTHRQQPDVGILPSDQYIVATHGMFIITAHVERADWWDANVVGVRIRVDRSQPGTINPHLTTETRGKVYTSYVSSVPTTVEQTMHRRLDPQDTITVEVWHDGSGDLEINDEETYLYVTRVG